MPELPEVETVCRGLIPHLLHKCIKEIRFSDKKLRLPYPQNAQALKSKKITNIKRFAKFILITLDDDLLLVIHLGMSGRISIQSHNYTPQKHDHMLLFLNDNSVVVYCDPRRFGLITLIDKTQMYQNKFFKNYGIDPFDDSFNKAFLKTWLDQSNATIKARMLDQRGVVGLGNIYILEALFKAKVSPLRLSKSLSLKEREDLFQAIIVTLKEAIEKGGSTLKDHRQVSGALGYFQHHFLVYGRDKKSCSRCGDGFEIVRIKQHGRSSFYCPNCQK